jgi:hypothetical protein
MTQLSHAALAIIAMALTVWIFVALYTPLDPWLRDETGVVVGTCALVALVAEGVWKVLRQRFAQDDEKTAGPRALRPPSPFSEHG